MTVWVTEVRGGLHPDLIDPEAASDPAILLSTITFVPASPFQANAPVITACDEPDDEGRPYLLHTQLIQELHWLSDVAAAPPPPATAEPKQLATLAAYADDNQNLGDNGILVIDAWFHLDDPVRLPETITVTDENGASLSFSTSPVQPDASGFAFRWGISSDDAHMMRVDHLQLSALFPANTVLVKDPMTTLAQVEQAGLTLLDADEATGDVTAYAQVRVTKAPTATTNVEFVTVSDVLVNSDMALIELWFHIEPHGVKDDAYAVRPAVKLFDDTTGDELEFQLSGPAPWSRNVWRAQIVGAKALDAGIPLYIRHQYLTEEFGVQPEGADVMSLADWIAKNQLTYLGWEPDQADIIAFSRSASPDQKVEPFPKHAIEPVKAVAPVKAAKKAPAKAPARKSATKAAPAKAANRRAGGHR